MRQYFRCPLEVKAAADGDEPGTFEGYGSVYNVLDSYGDIVVKGAFEDTLKAWKAKGKLPPMLLQHGGGMFGGSALDAVPIGKWEEMREDDTGLFVKGRLLAMDTDRGRTIYAAAKDGGLDGLSIGFTPKQVKVGTKPTEPARTLQKVDLWELSLVVWPANPDSLVESVKSAREYTERDLETILRDAGFSRKDAQIVISKGFRALRDSAPEMDRLLSDAEKRAYLRQFAA